MWFALPCSKANGGNLIASVEGKLLAIGKSDVCSTESLFHMSLFGV